MRKKYLQKQDIPEEKIIEISKGRDTIGECLAARTTCQQLGIKNILLVTSVNHEPRALWIFKRIFGDDIKVDQPNEKYLCEDKLNPKEEQEIFELTKQFLAEKFGEEKIPDQNTETWFEDTRDFYETQAEIHRKYVERGEGHVDAYEASGDKRFGKKEI